MKYIAPSGSTTPRNEVTIITGLRPTSRKGA